MIRNFLTATPTDVPNCHDGEGTIQVVEIFDQFATAMPYFHYTVLPPGTSVGLHQHGNDEEFYVILEGNGIMTDEGQDKPVTAGDVIKNPPYGEHALVNISATEPLKMLVFEVPCTV
ncbi:MAG: cupin domain-containing protein [Defluviitaleaceae bacterium]|nr:cupin domain-containing protein [Defluviitaleaceae bacterium]